MGNTRKWLNSLFGTIAGSLGIISRRNVDFVPDGNNGEVFYPNDASTSGSWIGLGDKQMQRYAYEYCFPVSSVVDNLAARDTNGIFRIYNSTLKEGKKVLASTPYSKKLNELLQQPNPMQSWGKFRAEQVVYAKIFGYCPVLALVPFGLGTENTVSLINLPPWSVEPTKRKVLQATKLEELFDGWEVTILGKTFEVPAAHMMLIEDGLFSDEKYDYLLPKSKLIGLDMAVSNVCAAMEADNVLLKRRGALGFISHDAAATKDAITGYIPMTASEKLEIQASLSSYGMSLQQFQWAISRQAIKWNPISLNSAQLETKATVTAGEKAICHRYNFPYVLYEETDATYSNASSAAKSVYENNIMPNAEKDIKVYEKFFKAEKNGLDFEMDFSHLPVLQQSLMEKYQGEQSQNSSLLIEYQNDLITLNEWRTLRGRNAVTGGDTYYSETKPADSGNTFF